MTPVERFIRAIAGAWHEDSFPTLRIIGSTALMLQTDYERGTKDSDVLETAELDGATKERLLLLAGKGTVLAQRWRLYLDIVDNGLPFLPQTPNWHRLASFPNHQVFALDRSRLALIRPRGLCDHRSAPSLLADARHRLVVPKPTRGRTAPRSSDHFKP
ncbi:MAG: hypothetical protein JJ863_34420 [Deltaproteobacteria bacterium]|nr:hypothetical protein [Deltaproteobacteria bacterium]